MKERQKEFALVLAVVAILALLLRSTPTPPTPQAAPPPRSLGVKARVQPSEDAKWILKTATDSYAPKVPVEKTWKDKPKISESSEK